MSKQVPRRVSRGPRVRARGVLLAIALVLGCADQQSPRLLAAEHECGATVFDGSGYGLSSEGFLDLFEQLQNLRAHGASLQVIGFQDNAAIAGIDKTFYERALARQLLHAADVYPNAQVIVLVGNLHARRTPIPGTATRPGFDPMAMHLPQASLLSFDLRYSGGDAYNCAPDGCGVRTLAPRPEGSPPRLEPIDGLHFDGVWAIGQISAARPLGRSG